MAANEEHMKVPVFDGHYEHWSEMMENLLRAKGLWKLIDPRIKEPKVGISVTDAQKKKLEEFHLVDLQKRFAGNERVKRSMLQKLRRDFGILEMKNGETIPEYFGRVLTISNLMKSNGEEMTDTKILEKILITLSEKCIKVDKEDEHALKIDQSEGSSGGRGRGRGRFGSRGRGRGRGKSSFNKETIECYRCHKLGHFSYECRGTRKRRQTMPVSMKMKMLCSWVNQK
ncbi:uncharacterized protein LOC143588456 [Bidens hawaiensis]|uniref:uncharacterized protein LOC143588456 n=1 Tax=Bidens hawaiensis TaxID=980011 RepID=UPI00404945F4